MRIRELIWSQDRVDHITAHGVSQHEVDQVCFGDPLVLRGKTEGENPVYYVLGQTAAGRYLFCVLIQFPDSRGYPVTARAMTEREQRRFNKSKNR